MDPLGYLQGMLEELRVQGLAGIEPAVLGGEASARSSVNGRAVINLASSNYLGLASDARVKQAAIGAIQSFGLGPGSVRGVAGTTPLHLELERRLAEFFGTEAALLFQSGFCAGAGALCAILGRDDVVVSDELNQASVVDGCRLSGATIKVFRHKSVQSARTILKRLPSGQRRLLVTDGVFSMDGDLAPLPALCDLAAEFGAIMMVNDSHAVGIFGRNGRGTVDHFGMQGRVDVQVGTMAEALGVLGGYVAGSRMLTETLRHRARPFLYSVAHPPALAAACLAALDILTEQPGPIAQLWKNTALFRSGLETADFDIGATEGPIVPVIVGSKDLASQFSERLLEKGVFAPGVAFPAVPRGLARIRAIVTAGHTEQDLRDALEAFRQVGRDLGVVS